MISTVRDEDDYVVGYCEWRQVGQSGFDVKGGRYIYVADIWVHESLRHTSIILELIEKILEIAPEAQYCYFTHRKYGERMSRLWKRERFVNRVKELI